MKASGVQAGKGQEHVSKPEFWSTSEVQDYGRLAAVDATIKCAYISDAFEWSVGGWYQPLLRICKDSGIHTSIVKCWNLVEDP